MPLPNGMSLPIEVPTLDGDLSSAADTSAVDQTDPSSSGSGYTNTLQAGTTAPTNPNGSTISTDPSGLAAGLLSGSEVAGFAPESYQNFGNVAQVDPSTYTAGTYTPTTVGFGGPTTTQEAQTFDNQVQQELAPTFAAQQMSQDDNLASRGIVNSGAATYLNNQLAGQQDSALASAEAPLTQQFAGDYQQDQIANANAANTAFATNAASGNTAAEYNAQASNNANLANAGYYSNAVTGNENNYNNYENSLMGDANSYSNALLSGYLGSYGGANSSALSTLGEGASSATAAYENGYTNPNNSVLGAGFANALSGINIGGGSSGSSDINNPLGISGSSTNDYSGYGALPS